LGVFVKYLAVLILAVTSALAQKPVAELPRVYINTTYQQPGGTTWNVHDVAHFSTALSASLPGDIIVLDAGVTYQGNFTLPSKPNPSNKWLYIISSALSKLPEGKRVSPTDSVNMPMLVTPNVSPVFTVKGGANYWRLAGLEITALSNYPSGCPGNGKNCMSYFLIGSQFVPTPPTPEPDSITIDRSYIHGGSTQDLQSAVQMTASNYAVVDSYISDVHDLGTDCQAMVVYWSPGPIKIVNNYAEAATENILFGGAGGAANPWVPSDIEIRNNYIFKPLSWVPLSTNASSNQNKMVVKNAFEVKSAQRVLFDSNTIENVWAGGQIGHAIVLTVRSGQSGDIAVINDITITNNVLKNVVSGFNSLMGDDTCGTGYPNCHNPGSADRWNISNNLLIHYPVGIPGGNRESFFQINGGTDRVSPGCTVAAPCYIPARNILFQHNTEIPPQPNYLAWGSVYFSAPNYTAPKPGDIVTQNIWLLDNVMGRQPSGDGGAIVAAYMGDPATFPQRFAGNEMYVAPGQPVQKFPTGNLASLATQTFDTNFVLLTPALIGTDGRMSGYAPLGNKPLPPTLKATPK